MAIFGKISPTGINSNTSGLDSRNIQQLNDVLDDIRGAFKDIGIRKIIDFQYQTGFVFQPIKLPRLGFRPIGLSIVKIEILDSTTTFSAATASPFIYWGIDGLVDQIVIRQIIGFPNNNKFKITVEIIGEA